VALTAVFFVSPVLGTGRTHLHNRSKTLQIHVIPFLSFTTGQHSPTLAN
jgi:hypothetical protein